LRALDQIVDLRVLAHRLAMDRVLEPLERRFEVLESLLELGELGLGAIRSTGRVDPTGETAAPEAHEWWSFLDFLRARPSQFGGVPTLYSGVERLISSARRP
jgi:hypothetical protein